MEGDGECHFMHRREVTLTIPAHHLHSSTPAPEFHDMPHTIVYLDDEERYFHVFHRSAGREKLFLRSGHYLHFRRLLFDAFRRSTAELVSYVLMPDRFHILLYQRAPGETSRVMERTCHPYEAMFGREMMRNGHPLQEAYRMIEVDSEEMVLHLSRFMHLAPVHAGLVRTPDAWPYSDYRAAVGIEQSGIETHPAVVSSAGGPEEYRRFVAQYRDEERKRIARYLY